MGKVIVVNVHCLDGVTCVTDSHFFHKDSGCQLVISGLNLETGTQVHFSLTEKSGKPVSMIGVSDNGILSVDVPDNVLNSNTKRNDYDIYAFVYCTDENSGWTEHEIVIPVRMRPDKEFENPTSEELTAFDKIAQYVSETAESIADDREQINKNKEDIEYLKEHGAGGGDSEDYKLPQATETNLGGVKASPKTDNDTVEARIVADGKLYVPAYPEQNEIPVDSALDKTSTNPVQNKAVAEAVDRLSQTIADHENDTTKHITSAERTKWNKNTADIATLNETLANMQVTIVESVEEMTDTSKQYVLKSTGTVWEYKETTTKKEVTVTDTIEATDDNPYYDNSRLSSSATEHTFSTQKGYHVTPKIDLTKYAGKTIQLHLEGAVYVTESNTNYIMNRAWDTSDTQMFARGYSNVANSTGMGSWHNIEVSIEDSTNAILTIDMPLTYSSAYLEIGYLAFCGQGAVADSNIYITYTGTETVTETAWVDTGVAFGSGGSGIDTETLAKISELNNEGADPATIKLLTQPVLDFYNAGAYSDSDYTTSHLEKITYPCRADIPVPFTVKWNHNEDAMRTTLVLDTKAIGTVNNYRMRIYDVTGFDNYPLYNLLPNTRYYYKVTHVLADGNLVEAKSGTFTTSSETIRLLNIDGTQNVRDLGGWTGLYGKTVKYGKLIRGASLSDSSFNGLIVTGKGRLSLGELKIQAELNLGATDTETSIASNCSYQKVGYNNYATAITDATARANFKTVLEKIVSWLSESTPRNVYFHCQGGCDRTGTLSFQLLGLLGVSESDLAKEYELSSFSDIGFGRLRTTTLAVDVYDYVGMVEAIKAYDGSTITDKFYNFAIDCGISADTITSFRSLMLE